MSQIRFENVNYIYSGGTTFEKQALKDVSFAVESGSFIGVIGHTGSGKSTLIQHMNGLIRPTSGKIYFHDEDITADGYKKKELRSKVGIVFQYPEYQLFEIDVLTDVAFGPKNLGLSQEESRKRAIDALQLVGIKEEQYTLSPFELSGGQKRRVAIAGVLAMQPEVLILDEPAAGLDPGSRKEILDTIVHLYRETGMTVILSSHSMEDMAEYAERLLVMNQGELVMDGLPHEIFGRYKELEKMGLSAPKMTYLMHSLAGKGYDLSTDILTVSDAAEEILNLWRNDTRHNHWTILSPVFRDPSSGPESKTAWNGFVCHICFFDSQCSGFYHCDGSDGSFDCAVKSTGELYAERVKIHFYDYSLNLLFQPFSDAGRQFIQDWFFECNCTGIKDRSLYGHASELSDYWLISDDIDHNTEPADRWS